MNETPKPLTMRALSLKVALVIALIVAVAGGVYLAFCNGAQQSEVEAKVLAEARTLNKQMQAAWDYIDDAQIAINTDKDGNYDFKNVYCAVAGKGIARRFTQTSDGYVIRYVRENPRSGTDAPDEFERRALNHFTVGGSTEYYEITEYKGEPVLRYSSVLEVRNNCLECHGGPAGEKDVTGFVKEGMEIGDVAGAVSMVIPMGSYVREAAADKTRSVAFFVALALLIAVSLSLVLRRWVAVPLERANARLANENEEQSNFLALMSHELRTPLSSIIAFTDIWEKSDRARDAEEERLVGKIKESSSALLNMVNNTIDVARLEAGSLALQIDETDLVDVMGAVFATAEPLALQQSVTLSKFIDPAIPVMRTDGEALRKIMLNLVGNALKFTPPGGSVAVEAHLEGCDRWVRLTVTDTGFGIASEDCERIFEKFSQASAKETPGRKAPGSGLGLYLVQNLAERLGGEVHAKSEVGKGSTFTVYVPVESEEEQEESDEQDSAGR